MSSVTQGVWRPPQQVATPGIGLLFTFRMTGLVPNSQALQLYTVPDASLNPNQIRSGANIAWNSNPAQRHAKPQQGLKFYTSGITIADPNGTLRNTGNLAIQLKNLTQNVDVLDTPLLVTGVGTPGADGQAAFYPVGGGQYGISFVRAIRPYDELQIGIQTPSNTLSTATACTVIVHGMWI